MPSATEDAAAVALHDEALLKDVTSKAVDKFLKPDASETCKQCVLYRSLRALRTEMEFYSRVCQADVVAGQHKLPICDVISTDVQRACLDLVDVSASYALCDTMDSKCAPSEKRSDAL